MKIGSHEKEHLRFPFSKYNTKHGALQYLPRNDTHHGYFACDRWKLLTSHWNVLGSSFSALFLKEKVAASQRMALRKAL